MPYGKFTVIRCNNQCAGYYRILLSSFPFTIQDKQLAVGQANIVHAAGDERPPSVGLIKLGRLNPDRGSFPIESGAWSANCREVSPAARLHWPCSLAASAQNCLSLPMKNYHSTRVEHTKASRHTRLGYSLIKRLMPDSTANNYYLLTASCSLMRSTAYFRILTSALKSTRIEKR